MIKISIVLVVLIWIESTKQHEQQHRSDLSSMFGNRDCAPLINCPYIPRSRTVQQSSHCCRNLTKTFYCSWRWGGAFLTRYLQLLSSWNCSEQLDIECRERSFAWSDFSSKAYLVFCDPHALRDACLGDVMRAIESDEHMTWSDAIKKIDVERVSDENYLKSCVQLAIYDRSSDERSRDFVETVDLDYILCELVWSGFDGKSLAKRDHLSWWDVLPPSCKTMMTTGIAILILLGVVGLIVNILLIILLLTSPTLRHCHYVYKTSIAVSDVLNGAFVFPSVVYDIAAQTSGRALRFAPNQDGVLVVEEGVFGRAYLNVFGIFSFVVVFVSIYTLLIAAADRLYAVWRPLAYTQMSSRRNAIRISLVVWFVAFLFALAPVMVSGPALVYGVSDRALITMRGPAARTLLTVILGVPVPLMWALSSATFVIVRRGAKVSRSLRNGGGTEEGHRERRLAVTLLLMVGTFTLSILPFAGMYVYLALAPEFDQTDPHVYGSDLAWVKRFLRYEMVAFALFMSNTMWNFFIYNARSRHFRIALRRLFASRHTSWSSSGKTKPARPKHESSSSSSAAAQRPKKTQETVF